MSEEKFAREANEKADALAKDGSNGRGKRL